MSAKYNGGVYGFTTSVSGVGVSAVVGFSAVAGLAYSEIRNTSAAGVLFVTGASTSVANAVAGGMPLHTSLGSNILKIWGPAGFWVAAQGASAAITVMRGLDEGYNLPGMTIIP